MQARRLLQQPYKLVARTTAAAQDTGLAVLGTAPDLPALPTTFDPADNPATQALAQSVARLGAVIKDWTAEDALAMNLQYGKTVKAFARRCGLADKPDWRYIISSQECVEAIRREVIRLYTEGLVASADGLVAALVALLRKLEGRIVLQDGLMVSLSVMYIHISNSQ